MITNKDFLLYVATSGHVSDRLKTMLFDCMAFYKSIDSFGLEPDSEVASICHFGGWLMNSSSYKFDELFDFADDAVHAASSAVEKFREEHLTNPSDWQMTWGQYLLFNKICNELTSVSLRSAVMDFDSYYGESKKDIPPDGISNDNDLEDREL